MQTSPSYRSHPKYSVLIAAYNGFPYIRSCITSVLSQGYDSFELIVSNDHSLDETNQYLKSITHPKVIKLSPPHKMSMAEHWEWLLEHASGEWCIFVGQDDGLQAYFFPLADRLTAYAEECGARTITSRRAYYFWDGCQDAFGNAQVSYSASRGMRLRSNRTSLIQTLAGFSNYFELPQMYTTSLFHRDIIAEARAKQHGKVFVTHPQDANLAALGCSLDSKHVRSEIPLGWVGSSPKSAGLAVVSDRLQELRDDYIAKVQTSTLEYSRSIGDFALGLCALYFWGALLQTDSLRGSNYNAFLRSKFIKYCVFLSALYELHATNRMEKTPLFKQVVASNSCSYFFLKACFPAYAVLRKCAVLLSRVLRKFRTLSKLQVNYERKTTQPTSMEEASKDVLRQIQNSGIFP